MIEIRRMFCLGHNSYRHEEVQNRLNCSDKDMVFVFSKRLIGTLHLEIFKTLKVYCTFSYISHSGRLYHFKVIQHNLGPLYIKYEIILSHPQRPLT